MKNAVEAAKQNTKISIQHTAQDGCAIITIKNTGAVPDSIRERFFEKYVSASKDKGTGIGTYSARLMAQVQGGDIKLDCSQDDYTSLIVSLPKWGG